ncbi:DPT [Branchiostoma lanceolatum]|uniref:DPT protein n=1 Tax=Branchiostoma lanceolatum TaxID=7740 RepID=A0A8J9ZJL6_BRALA|nr:DPT [Branchiostoma lanceolatum]
MSPLAAVAMLLVPLAAVVATTPVQGSRVGRQLAPEPDNSSADDSAAVSGTNSSSSSTGAAAAPRPGAACNASGHGTEFGSSFTFECRESYALSAVGSRYCSATGDRAWNYSCTYMGLGQLGECYWSPFANDLGSVLWYQCPFNSLVTGFYSEYDAAQKDRRWKLKCCRSDSSVLDNCAPLSLTVELHVSHEYDAAQKDRRWKLKCCRSDSSVLYYCAPLSLSLNCMFHSEYDAAQKDRRWKPNEYDEAQKDRRWKLKCCRSDSSVLYNCQNSLPANTPTGELHFSVFGNYFLRGVFATFKRNVRRGETDRRFQFVSCKKRSGN